MTHNNTPTISPLNSEEMQQEAAIERRRVEFLDQQLAALNEEEMTELWMNWIKL